MLALTLFLTSPSLPLSVTYYIMFGDLNEANAVKIRSIISCALFSLNISIKNLFEAQVYFEKSLHYNQDSTLKPTYR